MEELKKDIEESENLNQERIKKLGERDKEIEWETLGAYTSLISCLRQNKLNSFLMKISSNFSINPSLSEEIVKEYVIRVPDIIKNSASEDFYVHYDSEKKLYIGMERLTQNNIGWWKQKMGWDACMQYGKKISIYMTITLSEENNLNEFVISQKKQNQNEDPFDLGTNTIPCAEESEFISMAFESSTDKPPLDFQQVYEKYESGEENDGNYLGALRGFKMNLDQYENVPTWVAYITPDEIKGSLKKAGVPVTTSSLKIAMTLTDNGSFYSPLGINACSVARATDDPNLFRRLSNLLHSSVAKMMGEINPKIEYMVTRPLSNMHEIFKKSGVSSSSSFGELKLNQKQPVILREGSEGTENIDFGDCPYVLFDPETKKTYQIGHNHPFSTNYFLGGIEKRYMKLPFVTMSRKELAHLQK